MLLIAAAVGLAACATSPAATATAAAGGISREQDRALPPMAPGAVRAEVVGGRVVVGWNPVGLEILRVYRITRLAPAGPAHVGDVPADQRRELGKSGRYTFTDPRPASSGVHVYTVTAVDRDGNASAPARVSVDAP